MSVEQLNCLMNYRKACKCCLMFLSGSGLSGCPEINFSIFIKLQADFRSKKFKCVLERMLLGRRWGKSSFSFYF